MRLLQLHCVSLACFAVAAEAMAAPPSSGGPRAFTYAHGLIFLDGLIEDRNVLCLVDTGASLSAIDGRLADEVGLEIVGETKVLGSAGEVNATIVKLSSLTMGGQTINNLQPTKREIHHGATPDGRRLDLIVGHDYLKNFAVFVDYQAQQLEFGSPPVECMWIDVDLKDRIPHVAATLERSHHTLLRIDTGASLFATKDIYINLTEADLAGLRQNRELEPKGSLTGSGVGGEIKLQVFHLQELSIGPILVPSPRAIIQPRQGYFALPEAIGFFGNNLLEKFGAIVLDYPGSRLGVNCRRRGS